MALTNVKFRHSRANLRFHNQFHVQQRLLSSKFARISPFDQAPSVAKKMFSLPPNSVKFLRNAKKKKQAPPVSAHVSAHVLSDTREILSRHVRHLKFKVPQQKFFPLRSIRSLGERTDVPKLGAEIEVKLEYINTERSILIRSCWLNK